MEPRKGFERTPATSSRAPGDDMTTRHTTFETHQAQILKALQAGVSRVDAAREARISSRTIDRWVERGRSDPDSIYGDFAHEVDTLRVAREVPLSDERMSRDDVLRHLSIAIRAGSVQAMRVWLDQDRRSKGRGAGRDSNDPMTAIDELAQCRRQGSSR
jgi:hypothetical protein